MKDTSMPDDFDFAPAVRTDTAVVLALCGGSGSGKTKSALLLATGLAGDGDILMIDSEGGRGKHYAPEPGAEPDYVDTFKFRYWSWEAPYTPESLGRVLRAAEKRKISVVIVDSMSSEHEDEGGLCDMAEAEYQKQAGSSKNSAAAWAKPKASHKHEVVRWLRTERCHAIFCCRASEKVRFEKAEVNGRERTVIVPIGWTPIAEKNLLYDVTTSLLFTPDHPGFPRPIKLYSKHEPFFPPDRPVTIEAGRLLGEWAAGAALLGKARAAANQGSASLEAFWHGLARGERKDIGLATLADLKATAAERDGMMEESDAATEA